MVRSSPPAQCHGLLGGTTTFSVRTPVSAHGFPHVLFKSSMVVFAGNSVTALVRTALPSGVRGIKCPPEIA